MFSELMTRINFEIAASVFRTSASITAFESFLRNLPQKLIHEMPPSTMSQPDPERAADPLSPLPENAENGDAAPVSTAPVERQLPIRHSGPVLARNAQCPMGSGKKFKYCCGATGAKVCTGAGMDKK
jgi:uncharacterized protein YecA (UPF0149 family)